MRMLLFSMLLTGVIFAPFVSAQAPVKTKEPLHLGVLPYAGPRTLARTFLPMVQAMEAELERPVLFHTAVDFKDFFERTANGEFDIYFTAPHMAAYSDIYLNAIRIKRLKKNIRGLLLAHREQPFSLINDLRLKTVATPDPYTVLYLLAKETLTKAKLIPGQHVYIQTEKTYFNALLYAQEQRVNAVFILEAIFNHLDRSVREQFIVVSKTREIPGPMFLAKQGTSKRAITATRAFLSGEIQPQLSKEFFDRFKYGHFVDIEDEDIENLRSFANHLTGS